MFVTTNIILYCLLLCSHIILVICTIAALRSCPLLAFVIHFTSFSRLMRIIPTTLCLTFHLPSFILPFNGIKGFRHDDPHPSPISEKLGIKHGHGPFSFASFSLMANSPTLEAIVLQLFVVKPNLNNTLLIPGDPTPSDKRMLNVNKNLHTKKAP